MSDLFSKPFLMISLLSLMDLTRSATELLTEDVTVALFGREEELSFPSADEMDDCLDVDNSPLDER